MKNHMQSKTHREGREYVCFWVYETVSTKPEALVPQRGLICKAPAVQGAAGSQPRKCCGCRQWISFVWLACVWQEETDVRWTHSISKRSGKVKENQSRGSWGIENDHTKLDRPHAEPEWAFAFLLWYEPLGKTLPPKTVSPEKLGILQLDIYLLQKVLFINSWYANP